MMGSAAMVCVGALAVLVTAAGGYGEVHRVNDLATLEELVGETANPGDIIELPPGRYYLEDSSISVRRNGEPGKPITIRGVVKDGRRPVIDASRTNVNRGIFRVLESAHDIVFEDLELCQAWGSRFPERPTHGTNAAAIFFHGRNVTARRLHVHDNENGFFATDSAENLLVEKCEVGGNGTTYEGPHNLTHNFYFNALRQVVQNNCIHDSRDGVNFKSRGYHTIFAYNWVEEDIGYCLDVASGNRGNTLWIGNLIVKRTAPGGQRRLLVVGDGAGPDRIAEGTLTLVNNTIVSTREEDMFLAIYPTSTADVVLINNVFAGPGSFRSGSRGQGRITGTHNWFRQGLEVPEGVVDSVFGEDPGFTDLAGQDFRPRRGSALIDAGHPEPRYLNEQGRLEAALPEYEPRKDVFDPPVKRVIQGTVDIGAFESAGP